MAGNRRPEPRGGLGEAWAPVAVQVAAGVGEGTRVSPGRENRARDSLGDPRRFRRREEDKEACQAHGGVTRDEDGDGRRRVPWLPTRPCPRRLAPALCPRPPGKAPGASSNLHPDLTPVETVAQRSETTRPGAHGYSVVNRGARAKPGWLQRPRHSLDSENGFGKSNRAEQGR